MAISGHDKARLTARAGVLRAGTGRAGAVADSFQMYSAVGTTHVAGEFKYKSIGPPEDDSVTYTNVSK